MKNLNDNYVVDTSGEDPSASHAPLLSLPLVAKICPKSGGLVATPKHVYCICKRRPLLRTFWNASIRVADFPKLGFFADFRDGPPRPLFVLMSLKKTGECIVAKT